MDIKLDLINRISEGPAWVYWWTRVIDSSNWLLIPFAFFDVRARWALLAWSCNIVMILALYNLFGYSRILGLSHIIAWTPLMFYLLRERKPFAQENWAGRYLYWFMSVVVVSLAFDYFDLGRYLIALT
ncbi:MAG: hypothetical protein ACI9FR_002568 [Cryomorphaceae bacterium]|jgi:hypothetical protein